jgi:glycosyltransferase involved in cell wall biosynthesis
MSKNPVISVIMSTYNCQDFVVKAISSILNQSFTDFEFLIADDCSTDKTKEIIEKLKDKRVKKFYNHQNKHLVETWNHLASIALGKYIVFHDADDIAHYNRLESLYRYAENNPNLVMIGSNYSRSFPKWKDRRISNYGLTDEEIRSAFANHKRVELIKPLIRKSVFDEMGGFRQFFSRRGWEDYDLYLRIMEKYEVGNIADVLYEYCYTPNSSSKIKIEKINYKNFFINEIGFFIHNQRKHFGYDALITDKLMGEFNSYLEKLEANFIQSPSMVYKKIARNQIANKDFFEAIKNIKTAIIVEKSISENWSLITFWCKSLLKSIIKYLSTK